MRQFAAARPAMFSPHRDADEPWAIRMADVKTGAAREVFKADKGDGSAFQAIVAKNQLSLGRWRPSGLPMGEGRVAASVLDAAGGGTARLLTPGAFEVEYATLSSDGRASSTTRTRTTSIAGICGRGGCGHGRGRPRSRKAAASSGSRSRPPRYRDRLPPLGCAGAAARRGRCRAGRPRATSPRRCRGGISVGAARRAAAGGHHRRRRHADPRPALRPEGSQGRREAARR